MIIIIIIMTAIIIIITTIIITIIIIIVIISLRRPHLSGPLPEAVNTGRARADIWRRT